MESASLDQHSETKWKSLQKVRVVTEDDAAESRQTAPLKTGYPTKFFSVQHLFV